MLRISAPISWLPLAAPLVLALCLQSAGGQQPLERADSLFQAGKFADAQAAYLEALKAQPDTVAAQVRLGEIALLGNRLDEAVQYLKQILDRETDHEKARAFLAEAYYRQKRFDQAAPLQRARGRDAVADKLDYFHGKPPYEIAPGVDRTELDFVQIDPLPIVRARINDSRDVYLLIDLGAPELVLDAQLADELGLKRFGAVMGTFAGGKQAAVEQSAIDALTLGDFDIRNVPATLMPLRSRPMMGMREFDGILGTIPLYHFVTTLDYHGGRLILRRPTPAILAELDDQVGKAVIPPIPFWMAGDHFMVAWGQVNQAEPCLLLLDTGMAGGGFGCTEETLKAANIELTAEAGIGMGGGGAVRITPITVRELSLGQYRQHNVRGFYGGFPKISENGWGFKVGGIVSHGFLRRAAITLDFVNMRFLVEPAD